jgi:hypothetical protein
MMTEDELTALAKDIKANGQLDPIITMKLDCGTVIVDGRNPFEACKLAAVQPVFKDIGDRDPISLVASRGRPWHWSWETHVFELIADVRTVVDEVAGRGNQLDDQLCRVITGRRRAAENKSARHNFEIRIEFQAPIERQDAAFLDKRDRGIGL